jgi:hypothetical protein
VGELPHRVLAVSRKYVDIACGLADYSDVAALAINETSRAMGMALKKLSSPPST